jgi:RNA polymerase sigma factor (sigma-70 family)
MFTGLREGYNMDKPMSTGEVVSKVNTLALKYRGYPFKEDLKQEALLAYYKAVDRGITDETRLVTIMRQAMHKFANYDNTPSRIPYSGANYRLNKDMSDSEYKKLSKGQKLVYDALRVTTKDFSTMSDHFVDESLGTDEKLEVKEAFSICLTEQEKLAVGGCVIQGYTAEEVAVSMGCTQQNVSRLKDSGLLKLREYYKKDK